MSHIKQTIKHCLKKPALAFWGVLFLDQAFKYATSEGILPIEVYKNHNALFGIPFYQFYLVIFFASIAFFLILNKKRSVLENTPVVLISLSLFFAGIFSNLIDRLTKGYILDYLTISDMFSFNFADLGIYSGVLILLWKIIGK